MYVIYDRKIIINLFKTKNNEWYKKEENIIKQIIENMDKFSLIELDNTFYYENHFYKK